MELEGWSFICGCAPRVDYVFFARERDDLAEQDIVATGFYVWYERQVNPSDRWTIYDQIVSWRAQGMASIKPATADRLTVALGSHGQFFELNPATRAKSFGIIAGLDVLIRRVAAIDDDIFAVG